MIDGDITKADGCAGDAASLRGFKRNSERLSVFRWGAVIAEPFEADLQVFDRIV